MEKKWVDLIMATVIFIGAILIGGVYVKSSSLGYTESSILFLAAVVAAGCYWIDRKKTR